MALVNGSAKGDPHPRSLGRGCHALWMQMCGGRRVRRGRCKCPQLGGAARGL